MFSSLSERLQKTVDKLRGRGRLTEANMKATLKEVRLALLDADVALPVVRKFVQQVKTNALGQAVMKSLNPGQALIKLVHQELTQAMGPENVPLLFNAQPPVVILVAGLQGSGKTTSIGKLAKFLKEREKKSVMVASTDVYRPAAITQLQRLAEQVEVSFYPSDTSQKPLKIAKNALTAAQKEHKEVLIVDTAGRLHVDEAMMDEVKQLHAALNPTETLFVIDAMTGQDAAFTAKAFNEALALTGVILTKTDGDARGGAALSVREITGKPIKFIGSGEKLEALEPFYPDRIANRILGMGDILSLVEEAERTIDTEQSKKLAKKIKKGKGFDLEDYRNQIKQMNNMGGVAGLMSKMPGMGQASQAMDSVKAEKMLKQTDAIISSMTVHERQHPEVFSSSRKRRVAKGSGTDISEVSRLLKQHKQMQKMMKKFAKPGAMKQLMRGMGAMAGKMPPGGDLF